MPYDPSKIVGEILGRPSSAKFSPAESDYLCPFIKTRCIKRSTALGEVPYPVCSIWVKRREGEAEPTPGLVCVCPKRFYEIDFLHDVMKHCWTGGPPNDLRIAREVRMEGFGNVDFVLADIEKTGDIGRFLSVELQAIDITGSVMPAYFALQEGKPLEKRPTYGLNWDNVYKRYITQLIRKGYFHHHWKSKIVAVIQDVVYEYICRRFDFMRSSDVQSKTVNIIFMSYRLVPDPKHKNNHIFTLDKVEGTSHANLQQAILYKEAPSRTEFCEQIKRSLSRHK